MSMPAETNLPLDRLSWMVEVNINETIRCFDVLEGFTTVKDMVGYIRTAASSALHELDHVKFNAQVLNENEGQLFEKFYKDHIEDKQGTITAIFKGAVADSSKK